MYYVEDGDKFSKVRETIPRRNCRGGDDGGDGDGDDRTYAVCTASCNVFAEKRPSPKTSQLLGYQVSLVEFRSRSSFVLSSRRPSRFVPASSRHPFLSPLAFLSICALRRAISPFFFPSPPSELFVAKRFSQEDFRRCRSFFSAQTSVFARAARSVSFEVPARDHAFSLGEPASSR